MRIRLKKAMRYFMTETLQRGLVHLPLRSCILLPKGQALRRSLRTEVRLISSLQDLSDSPEIASIPSLIHCLCVCPFTPPDSTSAWQYQMGCAHGRFRRYPGKLAISRRTYSDWMTGTLPHKGGSFRTFYQRSSPSWTSCHGSYFTEFGIGCVSERRWPFL